ncbi:Testis-expressed sequence 22 protein [Sciurus carolinensis]|uniref:Testis-expressed sequence 22 protein n=1 Tax=Sciurus carolinensis TaxID=30640 RepID=A0AA41T589_SCICA|nr:Testis-expressed sequence 22 protein [Sciurus carolinensis]
MLQPPLKPPTVYGQTLQMVCEPQEPKCPSRHWSISIDERRQLAVLGAQERQDVAGAPSQGRDITQMVAELVSKDVVKDVLLMQPLRSGGSTEAFHDVPARSTPFWQTATLKSRASQTPRS